VDAGGGAYVNGFGDAFGSGCVVRVEPDGTCRQVADEIAFGNGMALTQDGRTLIVAESFARRLTEFAVDAAGNLSGRRVWADLGDVVPDGICLDADGAVWYADVPNQRCVRVRRGAEVLAEVPMDRGCFACMLGGPDGRTLYVVAAPWLGFENMFDGPPEGQVLTVRAPAAHAGRP
jgi:sugar lactone lactonase YvrE